MKIDMIQTVMEYKVKKLIMFLDWICIHVFHYEIKRLTIVSLQQNT